jgi:hypothetical protein
MKLNDADMIYLGAAEASAVYAGATLVWEAEGEAPAEYTPTFFVTSTYIPSYSGATGDGSGMRDGIDDVAASVWASEGANVDYISADLGADVAVGDIGVMPIPSEFDGWGAGYNNGAPIQIATAAAPTSWISSGLLSVADNVETLNAINATCRFIRIRGILGHWISIAEFRVYPPGGRRGV